MFEDLQKQNISGHGDAVKFQVLGDIGFDIDAVGKPYAFHSLIDEPLPHIGIDIGTDFVFREAEGGCMMGRFQQDDISLADASAGGIFEMVRGDFRRGFNVGDFQQDASSHELGGGIIGYAFLGGIEMFGSLQVSPQVTHDVDFREVAAIPFGLIEPDLTTAIRLGGDHLMC